MSLRTIAEPELGRYWEAVSGGDRDAAVALAMAALDRGVPVEAVLDELVVAIQTEVGRLWAANEWTVAKEHAATAVGEQVVRRVGETLPSATGGLRVAVGCVEREWHALPALVVATTLRSRGIDAAYLGASTSRDQVVSHVLDTGPVAVLLSASLTSSLSRVRRHVEAVRGTGTPVVVGGRAFDLQGVRARRLGATAYAATPDAAIALLGTLPRHVPPVTALRHPGASEARAIQHMVDDVVRDVLTETDRTLGLSGGGEAATSPDDWRVVLATFVPLVVESLVGALLTEDPTVFADTRSWLGGLLGRRDADPRAVQALVDALRVRLADFPAAVTILAP